MGFPIILDPRRNEDYINEENTNYVDKFVKLGNLSFIISILGFISTIIAPKFLYSSTVDSFLWSAIIAIIGFMCIILSHLIELDNHNDLMAEKVRFLGKNNDFRPNEFRDYLRNREKYIWAGNYTEEVN